ncbi:MAG TPA: putative glycolipid-binding domain-containing protein [Acetobacteraceae bacterium]|nr:putative glycolipid-binding domain-containing protein [Acetobacteraceae bacterium]
MRWVPVRGGGVEHLHVRTLPDRTIRAESVVVGARGGTEFGLFYGLVMDQDWRVRDVELRLAGDARALALHADAKGHWHGADGAPLPELEGCIDIDISATPFTNTLPIRRIRWRTGEAQVIRVVYLLIPGLVPVTVEQRYSCIEPGRLYRYESLDSGFKADLSVDEDGLIIDYPRLFRRQAT